MLNVSLATATVLVAWLAQELKSFKAIPTLVAQAGCFAVALGLYCLGHWPPQGDAWLMTAISWALAANGVSSTLAAAGVASKTDTK